MQKRLSFDSTRSLGKNIFPAEPGRTVFLAWMAPTELQLTYFACTKANCRNFRDFRSFRLSASLRPFIKFFKQGQPGKLHR
jgi:hypothetical protein